MSPVLLAALDFLAAAVICVRRANRQVRRILDGRRQQATRVDIDDVLDLIAEAEGITRRAAAGESWEA